MLRLATRCVRPQRTFRNLWVRQYSAKDDSGVTPWYLTMVDRDEPKKQSVFQPQQIELPRESPQSLGQITDHLQERLGLSDILIFDLRGADFSTAVAKVSDFMVIGTARSAKHCQKCFTELNGFIKQEYNSVAYVEGNVNAREEKKRLRRIARKSNLGKSWGSNSSPYSQGFQNNSEAWFMIDCHVDNIFVNILTQERRKELNLEELYAPESERHKYQTVQDNTKPDGSAELNGDDNVLAGLRRLAYQRRQYSTVTPAVDASKKLSESLTRQDFTTAEIIVQNSKNDHSLHFLTAVIDSFAAQDVPVVDTRKLEQWQAIFNSCWPLVLPQATASLYWSARLRFSKMLNIANNSFYPAEKIVSDYLIVKRASGFALVQDDFLQFLQVVLININLNPKADYWELVRYNSTIVKALRLFDDLNDETLLKDELVVTMLLKTMVLNDEKRTRLHALYEVVDYLMKAQNLSPEMMTSILEILGGIRDWNKFFQFWELGAKDVFPGQDHRPWDEFLKIVVNSNDLALMNKIVNEGHLLWLKRNEVEMTKNLGSQLDKLFLKLDPQGIAFKTLKDYLFS